MKWKVSSSNSVVSYDYSILLHLLVNLGDTRAHKGTSVNQSLLSLMIKSQAGAQRPTKDNKLYCKVEGDCP